MTEFSGVPAYNPYYRAVCGNLLACLPLELRLRSKSTTLSHRSAIYYADLTVREGVSLEDAIAEARQNDMRRKEVGYDQAALDAAGNQGFSNGSFEEGEEDVSEVIDEFFPASAEAATGVIAAASKKTKPTLLEKLDSKADNLSAPAASMS